MPVLSAVPPGDEYDPFPPEASNVKPLGAAPQALEAKLARAPLDWADLASKTPPERRWAVRGWLGFGHVTLLVGPGGIGKTLFAQQLASCLALGLPFVGDIDEPRHCLMWACEDDHDELWRRQVQIARWCKAGLEAFSERLVIVPRHGLENSIAVTDFGRLAFTPRLAELTEQAIATQAEVVILDNVGQLYGAGENDRHAVTAFLNALSGALPGRALLLLAHPSRSTGSEFSGSSAWENVARTRLYLGATLPGETKDPEAEPPSDTVRYLARRKANYSPRDWRKMIYADGALTPEVQPESGGVVGAIRSANAEKTILAAIATLAQKGIFTTDGQRSQNFLPRAIIDYKLNDGLTRSELSAAMRALVLDGRIKREQVGKRENRTPLIGLVVA